MQAIKFGAAGTGYVCGTVGKPGVIVVQEWWGVTKVRVAAPPAARILVWVATAIFSLVVVGN